jgi:hypothetical protein
MKKRQKPHFKVGIPIALFIVIVLGILAFQAFKYNEENTNFNNGEITFDYPNHFKINSTLMLKNRAIISLDSDNATIQISKKKTKQSITQIEKEYRKLLSTKNVSINPKSELGQLGALSFDNALISVNNITVDEKEALIFSYNQTFYTSENTAMTVKYDELFILHEDCVYLISESGNSWEMIKSAEKIIIESFKFI